MSNTDTANRFTILDWIGIVYIILNIIGVFLFSIAAAMVGDSFKRFGGELSIVTVLATNAWFLVIAGIISMLTFSLVWHKNISANLNSKRLVIVIAFVVTSMAIALCFAGIFLPLLKLASPA